jgi:twitching motility protein PilT
MGLEEILRDMVRLGASDVHIASDRSPTYRVLGQLKLNESHAPLTSDDLASALERIVPPEDFASFQKDLELDFAFALPGVSRFRGNAAKERGTVTMVFRRILESVPQFDALGLPDVCKQLAMRTKGLVVVTGITGSGKSTTLAAMIEYINTTTSRKIVTLEDPIEYLFKDKRSVIVQRQLGEDTHSFAAALRHVLRQNPDVIMVGEMRDADTVAAALTASETGVLVLATAHAPSAAQTIERLIDMFPPHHQPQARAQISSVLEAVLYQRLLPTADGTSRVPAIEVMLGTTAIRTLIRDGKFQQLYGTIQLAAGQGMRTLDQALADLYKAKKISMEKAVEQAAYPDQLAQELRSIGVAL